VRRRRRRLFERTGTHFQTVGVVPTFPLGIPGGGQLHSTITYQRVKRPWRTFTFVKTAFLRQYPVNSQLEVEDSSQGHFSTLSNHFSASLLVLKYREIPPGHGMDDITVLRICALNVRFVASWSGALRLADPLSRNHKESVCHGFLRFGASVSFESSELLESALTKIARFRGLIRSGAEDLPRVSGG
jgi:hypothetical protein